MNMLYTCHHSSAQMETLIDNLSAKAMIIRFIGLAMFSYGNMLTTNV